MNIVLDSNIFISDFSLESPNWETLLDFINENESQIIIPQIILDEVGAEYERITKSLLDDYNRIANRLNKLSTYDSDVICIESEDMMPSKDSFIDYIKVKLDIEPFPYIDSFLTEVTQRAIKRIRPAKKDGRDFRDTLIWLSLKRICENNNHKQIVFISQNVSDFANENKVLHDDLTAECKEEGLNIMYYTSLKSFINDFVIQYSENLKTYDEKWLEENLDYKDIEDQLRDMLYGEDWAGHFEYYYERTADDFNVKYIEPMDIDNYTSYLLPNGDIILNIDMKGVVYVQEEFIDRFRDKLYEGNTVKGGDIEFSVAIKISEGKIIQAFVNDNYSVY